MKKQYIAPKQETIKMELQQIIALSGGIENAEATSNGSGDYETLGRGIDFDDWDD